MKHLDTGRSANAETDDVFSVCASFKVNLC